jgi:hypothetical protein
LTTYFFLSIKHAMERHRFNSFNQVYLQKLNDIQNSYLLIKQILLKKPIFELIPI